MRRRAAPPTSSASVSASKSSSTRSPMSNLFDLPFEEDEEENSPQSPVPSPQSSRPETGDRRLETTRRVLTVTELTVRVRDLLEQELFEVWVEGELSNCRYWNTGHLYFTLKDSGAQLKGVIF